MAGSRKLVRPRGRDVMLYDETGRPYNASATVGAWRAAAADTRMTRSWAVSDLSINALLAGDVAELRRRSRDLVRKNPWAQSGNDSYVANAVGTGIVPTPLTENDELRRTLMGLWEEFVEICDSYGTCDFYGLQALIERARKEGGECFVRVRYRDERDGLPIPLQLEVLEPELVDPSFEEIKPNGSRTRAGIEFDLLGRRQAYHFWREHPGEIISLRNTSRVRVPADSVIHVFRVLRPGQIRGIPDNASVIARLHELDKYDLAEVVRKQIASMFAAFVTLPDTQNDPLGGGTVEGHDTDGTPLARLEPGTVQKLGPGQDVKVAAPPSDGGSYSLFVQHQLRQVAAAIGVTYEQLTGDLSQVNYSSIRAGLIEFWRRMGQHQNTLIFQLCKPVWKHFITASILGKRLKAPRTAEEMRELMRVAWKPTPGREYVDPLKEAQALLLLLRMGATSRRRIVAASGADVEQIEQEIAGDNARADELELRFDGDARQPAGGAKPGAFGGDAAAGDDEQPEDEPEADDEDEAADDEEETPATRARVRLLLRQLDEGSAA